MGTINLTHRFFNGRNWLLIWSLRGSFHEVFQPVLNHNTGTINLTHRFFNGQRSLPSRFRGPSSNSRTKRFHLLSIGLALKARLGEAWFCILPESVHSTYHLIRNLPHPFHPHLLSIQAEGPHHSPGYRRDRTEELPLTSIDSQSLHSNTLFIKAGLLRRMLGYLWLIQSKGRWVLLHQLVAL